MSALAFVRTLRPALPTLRVAAVPTAAAVSARSHAVRLLSTRRELEEISSIDEFNRNHYFVGRTKSGNLPVYFDVKHRSGGPTTTIRKVDGNALILKEDLKEALELDDSRIRVMPPSNKIEIKGDYVDVVKSVLGAVF
ncbi:mitochondrial 54S ribosomal protein mL49 [Dipodascopsis tothii]|uniref:mitochondrial 54S ribosomal protein mL49 n=1 Tax=Dipodascopsis tothii TaxID=44089 RepID=UPI0034CFBFD5